MLSFSAIVHPLSVPVKRRIAEKKREMDYSEYLGIE